MELETGMLLPQRVAIWLLKLLFLPSPSLSAAVLKNHSMLCSFPALPQLKPTWGCQEGETLS